MIDLLSDRNGRRIERELIFPEVKKQQFDTTNFQLHYLCTSEQHLVWRLFSSKIIWRSTTHI